MGWHTPDEYFEHHVLPHQSYDEIKEMIAAERDGQSQLTAMESLHGNKQSSLGKIIDSYGYEQTLSFLDQARTRFEQRQAARAAALTARPSTVPLNERAVWVVMTLDEAWRELKRSRGEDGDGGPARVFLSAFDPSITFKTANLDLSEEVVGALEQFKDDLYLAGYFRGGTDPHLLADANTLLVKMRERLAA